MPALSNTFAQLQRRLFNAPGGGMPFIGNITRSIWSTPPLPYMISPVSLQNYQYTGTFSPFDDSNDHFDNNEGKEDRAKTDDLDDEMSAEELSWSLFVNQNAALEDDAFEHPRPDPSPTPAVNTGIDGDNATFPSPSPINNTAPLPPSSAQVISSNATERVLSTPDIPSKTTAEEEQAQASVRQPWEVVPEGHARGVSPKTIICPNNREIQSTKIFRRGPRRTGIQTTLLRTKWAVVNVASRALHDTPNHAATQDSLKSFNRELPPTFANPWTGSTIESGITRSGDVVYSTEAAWPVYWYQRETLKMSKGKRNYFGSDDDKVHTPGRT
ncbi:hypothetical protein D9757_010912 [Collybiopsis confluens]|uniref:Uncharacterized protein n=1 Tax=Collybiopsis confluens TaxID=2823264 RepID=A0A8H5LPU1_9AGAR|nr:hypothetical protein D9757_010912 [Collybiopsis confluens]